MRGGGLIAGCIVFFLQGNGPVTKWGHFSVGGEAHKRKFTVFTTRDTYNSTP